MALSGSLCMLALSACGSRPQVETDTETDFVETVGTLDTETESVTESAVIETAEPTEVVEETEPAETEQTELQTEVPSAAPSIQIPDITIPIPSVVEPSYAVIDSIYEDINMSWADACMLVLDCVLTTPVSYPGDPVFAAMYCSGAEEPLLITGHQTGDQAGNYYIYSFVNGKRIYQLGNYVGVFYWNQEADRFCLQVSGSEFRVYAYQSNHMVHIDTLPSLPEGYSVIPMNPLNVSPPITVDNLRNYIGSL